MIILPNPNVGLGKFDVVEASTGDATNTAGHFGLSPASSLIRSKKLPAIVPGQHYDAILRKFKSKLGESGPSKRTAVGAIRLEDRQEKRLLRPITRGLGNGKNDSLSIGHTYI